MPRPPEPCSDDDWLDLFREGGPKRPPKEESGPRHRAKEPEPRTDSRPGEHRPKSFVPSAFRAWRGIVPGER